VDAVHRHHVGAYELPTGRSARAVARAMRGTQHSRFGRAARVAGRRRRACFVASDSPAMLVTPPAPAAARLESSRYGPDYDFACAISDPEPHLSPIVMSGNGPLRGFCDNETWIDRGTTSSMAVRRGAPTSRAHWDLVWDFGAPPWRVASFRGPAMRPKVADLQVFPAMARPGLEPGTPRFSGSRSAAEWLMKDLQITMVQMA
jgi:hypothetical protein